MKNSRWVMLTCIVNWRASTNNF